MPIKSVRDSKNFIDLYDQYLDALGNWERWGTKVQELIDQLKSHELYKDSLEDDEKIQIDEKIVSARSVSPIPVAKEILITI